MLILASLALAGCMTEEEKQASASRGVLQREVDAWFKDNGDKVCPLRNVELWESPFSSLRLEPTGGTGDQFRAVMPFWCAGDGDDGSRRLTGVATVPAHGAYAVDYEAVTVAELSESSYLLLVLAWLAVPVAIVVLLLVASRHVPLHMLLAATPWFANTDVFLYPAVGVVIIAALVILGSCYWTHVILHSTWTYALTPLQIFPSLAILTPVYLRGLRR
jgi:hypothetical protein